MPPIVLGYRTDWNAADLPVNRIDFRPLTHIAHAFVGVKAGGALTFPEERYTRDLIAASHHHRVKVVLVVGGADSNAALSGICADPKRAAALADSVAAFVRKFGYDGVDVDWESPNNADDGNRLTLFVRLLRERLPRPLTISMAVSAVDWFGRWYDAPALLPLVDWMAVMCYDFYGAWSDHAGYHSGLFPSKEAPVGTPDAALLCGDAGIRYWREKKRWPADRLLLGIPLYGHGFRAAKWGDPVNKDPAANMDVAFKDTPRQLAGWKASRDASAVAAVWVSPDGSQRVAGDDAVTARQKGAWAHRQRLAGVFFWELSQDGDGRTLPSLVKAAHDGMATGK